LLAYREDPSFFTVGRALGVHHQTVQRCVERALASGSMAALGDRPRSSRRRTITAEARAWLVSLACRKAKELGYDAAYQAHAAIKLILDNHSPHIALDHGIARPYRQDRRVVPPLGGRQLSTLLAAIAKRRTDLADRILPQLHLQEALPHPQALRAQL
jgi:hypothetical protein